MTEEEVRALLSSACAKAGGQTAFASLHNLSQPHVSLVLQGEREPGPKILDALALEKVVTYRAKEALEHG